MPSAVGLEVSDMTVRYGGNVAVSGLSLAAPLGQITGLIGPNGAGKTSTFNACSGLVPGAGGSVALLGRDVKRLGPAARARAGIGRTFQRMELCESLTVRENIVLAREARHAGRNPLRHLNTGRAHRLETSAVATAAAEVCGIDDLADERVADLSTGQRRLVELARVVAGGYRVLLLDEPSSGLDPSETAMFGRVLVDLVTPGETGILLVEHDMALVMTVCEFVYVIDFGRLVFSGTPEEVRASDVVRAAYLGDDEGHATLEVTQ